MPRSFALLLTVATFLASMAVAEPPSSNHLSGVLTLTNGNFLHGQLVGGKDDRLLWRSSHFVSPFSFPIRQIQSVRLQSAAGGELPRDPLRFFTVGGDALTGTLRGVTDDRFQFNSARFGDVVLRRKHVRQIRRIGVRSTLQDGPLNKHDWKTIGRDRSIDQWIQSQEGHLTTEQVGAELFREFDFPDVAEVEIELQWKDKPAFVLAIAKPVKRRLPEEVLKVETWSEQLVLQSLASNGEFEKLIEFDGQKSLRLRMVLDQHTGELAVYSDKGELLGQLTTGAQPMGAGVYLKNKGADLTLASLRVNSLDDPDGIDMKNLARFEFRDGSRALAKIDSYDAGDRAFQVTDSKEGQRVIALESITGVSFPAAEKIPAAETFPATESKVVAKSSSILCHNDSRIHGRLDHLAGDRIAIHCAAADQPITLRWEDVKELRTSRSGEKPAHGTFATPLDGVRHTGRPAPAGEDGPVGWQPAGSETASPFVHPKGQFIERIEDRDSGVPEGSNSPAGKDFHDIVYLRSGDVIPCRVSRMTEESVHIETSFSKSHDIPCHDMRALELDCAAVRSLPPFEQWKRNGNLGFGDDSVTFEGQGNLSHQDVLLGGEIECDVQWHNNAYVILTLFTSHHRAGRSSVRLMIYKMNNQLHVQLQQPRQQMPNRALRPKGPTSRLKIVTGRDTISVTVDGQEVINQRIAKIDPSATGMSWQVQPLQVNVAGEGRRFVGGRKAKLLTVSHLHVGRSGMLAQLSVSDQLRRSMVTVPRSRRGNPPTHLLVARNGDLLRGRMVTLSDDRIHFISRRDDVLIQRERLNGIVWFDGVEEIKAKLRQDAKAGTDSVAKEVPREKPVHSFVVPPLGGLNTRVSPTHDGATNAGKLSRHHGPEASVDNGDRQSVQVTFVTGARFTFDVRRMTEDQHLEGNHRLLGPMRVPLEELVALKLEPSSVPGDLVAWKGWKLEPAEEPKFAETPQANGASEENVGRTSPLVGKLVSDASFPLASGSTFRVKDHAGKIVILDFWASWCGPCIQELPETMETVASFPAEEVVLIGVNQQENQATIDEFLAARGWNLQVGLDREGALAAQWDVEAIPQTVIIGRDGKIERVYTGARRGLQKEIRKTIEALLEG